MPDCTGCRAQLPWCLRKVGIVPLAQKAIATSAYALFALQQPVSLDQIADGAGTSSFALAPMQTPSWFAAAASEESSLLETAPELLVLPGDGDDDSDIDVTGIDLIRVYAPELDQLEEVEELQSDEEPGRPVEVVAKPRTSTQIGLLKELSNLDI
jgi:hypothetical protein